jgi:Tol biopolymer transport system component
MRLALAACVLSVAPLFAQEKPSDSLLTVNRYLDYETAAEPRVSPDGSQVIWTRRYVDKMKDNFDAALWLMNADGSKQRYLVKGGNAVWSPDGSRIAYLAEGEPGGMQIWVRYMDAEGATLQVTRLQKAPANIKWSPDGKWIGFSGFVPSTDNWRIDMPSAPTGAQWTKSPKIVGSFIYRADRNGYLDEGYNHLFVVPATGGTPRQVTKGEWNVGGRSNGIPGGVAWDWTPDGRTIVFEGNDDPKAEMCYRCANIYAIDVMGGAMRRLTPDAGWWSNPSVSPDGRLIAFTGAPASKDSYRALTLFTMSIDGAGRTPLTQALDRDPASIQWGADSKGLYFTADDQGTSNLWYAPSAVPRNSSPPAPTS